MFEFLFGHKKDLVHNSKKVKKWQAEHRALATLATDIAKYYEEGNFNKAKKELKHLQSVALNHLMDEDVTFTELSHQAENTYTDQVIVEAMKEFRESFVDTKKSLIHFFIHYTHPDTTLDENFITQLKAIIEALVKRIEFEENNLYTMIDK